MDDMNKLGFCYECDGTQHATCTGEDCDCLKGICPIAFLPPYSKLWDEARHTLTHYLADKRSENKLEIQERGGCSFVPLVGKHGWKSED